MKLAVIGTSLIVEKFVDAVSQCPELEVAAVYSRTEETARRFAEQAGIPGTYTDLEALAAATEIDGVYIASPNACHFEQSLTMLRGGKHVLCEKPATTCEAELLELLRVANQHGVVFLEASKHLFSPGIGILRDLLPEIGPIRRASLVFNQYSSRYDEFKQGIIHNVFTPELAGGALLDIGVYCVQMMVALFGLPREIVSLSVPLHTGVDGQGAVIAKYDGCLVELSYSKIVQAVTPNEIVGEAGSLVFEKLSRIEQVQVVMRDGETRQISCNSLPNQMVYEAQAFYEMAQNPEKAAPYHEYSRMALAVMDEIKRQQSRNETGS
ncbi:MAG: Gfo/Idh/MocA family oxidoreductase [Oscillospiraceae bacterium]|nr:Gfo/Idh/MocA family oxidoreductase [Oscillospiraceae bacterium]